MKRYIEAVAVQIGKDLRLEWRSKDAINAMLFLALLVVVLFSLAFDPTRAEARQIAGGVLCVAILFAATSALNQAWSRELRGGVLDAQRMSPSPPSALLLGKVVANFLVVSSVELVLAPLFTIFYNLDPKGNAWLLLAVLPLGTWALVGNGVFFAALSMRARSRELLLPLLLFPIFIPALLAMTSAAGAVFTGESDPVLWIRLLAGYDVIFTTAAVLLFGLVLNSEG
ncbi:heme exporter protein CcmB [Acidipila sp. EB88]|uniref:heme exporter protein CcmB n=1 Tax=Acidipila sp. EB88 TaxID=2305226 RepID=UPI001F2009F0|nr:heme exporter protein CcmB [Acidipila sp. EB88]